MADHEAQNNPPPPRPANSQRRIGPHLGNLYRQKNAHQPANCPGQIQSCPSIGILDRPLGIKHAPANPPGPINVPSPEQIPVQIQSGPSMLILGTPLGIKHAPANPPGPITLPSQQDIPVQIHPDPPMGILGNPLGIKHAPANPPGQINLSRPKIYLSNSKGIPQWVFLGVQWGCDMLFWRVSRKPPHRRWRIRSFNPLMWRGANVAQWQVCLQLVSFFGNNPDVFFLNLLT